MLVVLVFVRVFTVELRLLGSLKCMCDMQLMVIKYVVLSF